MGKSKAGAGVLNFFVWGLGYLYLGKRMGLGIGLFIGYLLVHTYVFFYTMYPTIFTTGITFPVIMWSLGCLAISIALGYDGYKGAE